MATLDRILRRGLSLVESPRICVQLDVDGAVEQWRSGVLDHIVWSAGHPIALMLRDSIDCDQANAWKFSDEPPSYTCDVIIPWHQVRMITAWSAAEIPAWSTQETP